MAPPNVNHWKTDPKYIELLSYIIKRTENVESPMSIRQLVKDFKDKSGAPQTIECLRRRIDSLRTTICSFVHIDTNTKVKLLFALSSPVGAVFLKQLNKDAVVEVDEKKQITYYKASDGSLELTGDHSISAKKSTGKLESKGSLRSMIINYFEKKGDADAIPKSKEEKEMGNLIEFITDTCVNVDTPLSITQFAEDIRNRFGIPIPAETIRSRVRGYCRYIQKIEFLDVHTKVQQLFGLSATVDSDYLEKLRKNARVEVDEKSRIVLYKANDRSLMLKGDHSLSAKTRTAMLESKGSNRSLIRSYYENKNSADAVLNNEKEKEIKNLIEFITEKCQTVDSLMNISQLTRDFIQDFKLSVPSVTIRKRIKSYGREIQRVDFLDTYAKVRQLFCLSVKLNSDCLKELRKDAVVEVDELNRITKYTAINGHLKLCGEHSQSAKRKLVWIERKKKINALKKQRNSGGDENEESEEENGYSEDDSDEYSSEEFDSEFDSDDEIGCMNSSNKVLDFENKTSVSNRSPSEFSIDNDFDFDPPAERSHRSEEIEAREVVGEKDDHNITENDGMKTRSERSSKRRHLDPEHSYNQANSSSSEIPKSTDSLFPKSAKQKKSAIQKEQAPMSSNQSRSSSRLMRKFTRNSSFPSISTESEGTMENQDAQKAVDFDNERSMIREQEEKENDLEITEIAAVKTRYGRLSKKRHLNSEFSYNLANSATPRSTDSSSPKPAKQKKIAIEKEQAPSSSNQGSSSSRPMRKLIGNSPFTPIPIEGRIELKKKIDAVKNQSHSDGGKGDEHQKGDDHSETDKDDSSSEESDSELHSKNDNDSFDETEDLMESSMVDFDDERSMRNDSLAKVPTAENFDFDPSLEKSHISEEIEMEEGEEKENDTGITERSKRRYSEDGSDFHPEESDDENDDLDKTRDLMEPSNEAYDSDNDTSVRSLAPSGISIDNNFDLDPPTEMREDDEKDDPDITENVAVEPQTSETLPRSKTSSSTSHTTQTPKRKADESAGSNSSKRTKPPSNKSMNPKEVGDNFSHDDPSRVDLNPVCGPLGLSNETQKDSDVQKIPKTRPHVMEAPIIEEYGEETQTSLETVLKAFKSLIISLDTPRLSQLLIELDTKIMESGRRTEISNKEMIMAMDFLIVKLSKHGSPKSLEDSISLRDILLMLRTIILNSSFKGLEDILEMLKENIDQLKVLENRVPMSKVESVLRATLDNIST